MRDNCELKGPFNLIYGLWREEATSYGSNKLSTQGETRIVVDLYGKYHLDRGDERLGLFSILRSEYGVERGLYPGCFVHVTPSFVIPEMVYVDTDSNARKFFEAGRAESLVLSRKQYRDEPSVVFIAGDYTDHLDIDDDCFDLIISQYAGFVSEACTRYLRRGGYLVANNSHGDAGLAHLNPDLEFVAAIQRRGERFSLTTQNLCDFFVPKSHAVPSDPSQLKEYLKVRGSGIGYKKSATDYLFRRL